MAAETFSFLADGGRELPATLWLPEGEARYVLQIAHGMTEHMGRYETLARELTARGAAVAGFDLRGHGRNGGDPKVASFGEGGWEASIRDMRQFFLLLEDWFPGAPHGMLGFSLGSFLLREYLGRYPEGVAGAAILGTGWQPGPVLRPIIALVRTQIPKAGFDGTTALVHQLSFGSYNRKFRPNRTKADWLCADEKQLNAYLGDPLCREDISAGLFWQLLDAMRRTGRRDAWGSWNRETPVLLLSGGEDPVGDFGKGVRKVKDFLQAAGIRDVELRLFPGARHDVLHDRDGAAARKALADWLEQRLGKASRA